MISRVPWHTIDASGGYLRRDQCGLGEERFGVLERCAIHVKQFKNREYLVLIWAQEEIEYQNASLSMETILAPSW